MLPDLMFRRNCRFSFLAFSNNASSFSFFAKYSKVKPSPPLATPIPYPLFIRIPEICLRRGESLTKFERALRPLAEHAPRCRFFLREGVAPPRQHLSRRSVIRWSRSQTIRLGARCQLRSGSRLISPSRNAVSTPVNIARFRLLAKPTLLDFGNATLLGLATWCVLFPSLSVFVCPRSQLNPPACHCLRLIVYAPSYLLLGYRGCCISRILQITGYFKDQFPS